LVSGWLCRGIAHRLDFDPALRQHFLQSCGEPSGAEHEAVMAAGERNERPAQCFGQGLSAVTGEPLALGVVAGGGNDAPGCSVDGGMSRW
jgi:hypothetical protein